MRGWWAGAPSDSEGLSFDSPYLWVGQGRGCHFYEAGPVGPLLLAPKPMELFSGLCTAATVRLCSRFKVIVALVPAGNCSGLTAIASPFHWP